MQCLRRLVMSYYQQDSFIYSKLENRLTYALQNGVILDAEAFRYGPVWHLHFVCVHVLAEFSPDDTQNYDRDILLAFQTTCAFIINFIICSRTTSTCLVMHGVHQVDCR